MTKDQKIIRAKVGLLEPAKQPAWGQLQVANALRGRWISVLPAGARGLTATRGREVDALLDPDPPVPGVT